MCYNLPRHASASSPDHFHVAGILFAAYVSAYFGRRFPYVVRIIISIKVLKSLKLIYGQIQ